MVTYGRMLANVHSSAVGRDERVDLGCSVSWQYGNVSGKLTKFFNTGVEGTVWSTCFMPIRLVSIFLVGMLRYWQSVQWSASSDSPLTGVILCSSQQLLLSLVVQQHSRLIMNRESSPVHQSLL